ncbi:hypothetical protein [Celeribacter sp.]
MEFQALCTAYRRASKAARRKFAKAEVASLTDLLMSGGDTE